MTNKSRLSLKISISLTTLCFLFFGHVHIASANPAGAAPGTSAAFEIAKIESWMLPEDEQEAYAFRPSKKDSKVHKNSFDFVCGVNTPKDTAILQGVALSFYNPNDFAVMLNNFVTVTFEDGHVQPEFPQRYLNVLLSPKRNFKVNCDYLGRLFFPDGSRSSQGFPAFRGSFYSKSMRYLDIILRYTGFAVPHNVNSDVSVIPLEQNL
jgi:hypothetical protein